MPYAFILFLENLPRCPIGHTDDVDATLHLFDTHTVHVVDDGRMGEGG